MRHDQELFSKYGAHPVAALDIATGKVISRFHRRQRHQEFLRFLERIDEAVPENLDIHL
jgi:putative transposase